VDSDKALQHGPKVKVTAPPIKNGSSELSGFYHSIFGFLASYRVSKYKIPREITDEIMLLSLWVHVVLYSGEFRTKTTAAPSQEVVEGGVMIFLEKNKVLGVEPNRECSVFTSNRPARLMMFES
jgi:hypothetical protein